MIFLSLCVQLSGCFLLECFFWLLSESGFDAWGTLQTVCVLNQGLLRRGLCIGLGFWGVLGLRAAFLGHAVVAVGGDFRGPGNRDVH